MTPRQLLIKTYGHLYTRWCFEGDTGRCFYCDEAPAGRDHAPALFWMDALVNAKHNRKYEYWMVPCCTECNALLGNRPLHTLYARAMYIEQKLSKKYEAKHVLWSSAELAQMSRTMQASIKARLTKNQILLDRIRAVQLRLANSESFPVDV